MGKVAAVLFGFGGNFVIVTRSDVIAKVHIAVMHLYTLLTIPCGNHIPKNVLHVG